MRWAPTVVMLASFSAMKLPAAELKPATIRIFDKYIHQAEQGLDSRRSFLWADESAERKRRLLQGEVVVEPTSAKPLLDIGDALIHDWEGSVFVAGIDVAQTIARLQQYDSDRTRHREVMDSRILHHEGNDFRVYMRLLKKKVVTVVLNTEHEVHYTPVDKTHWKSESKTVKIAEVADAGKTSEHELPQGTGSGFLWKLDTYWRFQERDGGTWIECRAISLTRDIPTGLGWLIEPIIRSLPKESLENTLRETASGLKRSMQAN